MIEDDDTEVVRLGGAAWGNIYKVKRFGLLGGPTEIVRMSSEGVEVVNSSGLVRVLVKRVDGAPVKVLKLGWQKLEEFDVKRTDAEILHLYGFVIGE